MPANPPVSYSILPRGADVQGDVEAAMGGEGELDEKVVKEKKPAKKTAKPENVPKMTRPKPTFTTGD